MTYQQKPKLNSVIKPSTMEKIESMIEKRVDGYYCINCGHTSKKRDHMKEHVEKHIEGLEYPCNSCNKIMRTSKALRAHKGTMFHWSYNYSYKCFPVQFSVCGCDQWACCRCRLQYTLNTVWSWEFHLHLILEYCASYVLNTVWNWGTLLSLISGYRNII